MKIKDALMLIIFLAFMWCAVSTVRPFWDMYWLGEDVRVAAIYGTKHSVEATQKFLTKKMMERGRDFSGEDFNIEKDEEHNVTISIEYMDEINFLGMILKKLDIKVSKSVSEVEAKF